MRRVSALALRGRTRYTRWVQAGYMALIRWVSVFSLVNLCQMYDSLINKGMYSKQWKRMRFDMFISSSRKHLLCNRDCHQTESKVLYLVLALACLLNMFLQCESWHTQAWKQINNSRLVAALALRERKKRILCSESRPSVYGWDACLPCLTNTSELRRDEMLCGEYYECENFCSFCFKSTRTGTNCSGSISMREALDNTNLCRFPPLDERGGTVTME